jgi:ligand-binding SRPBCC domain-containing protein
VLHHLSREQILPITLQEAWEFFSNCRNLDLLTPPDVGMEIVHADSERMYEGQIISYRIRLAPLVRVTWVTEIKAVEEGRCFIDEQRFGPYKFWQHRHSFEAVPGGVKVGDTVHYMMPFGPLGDLAHALFARRKLEAIFDYRAKAMGRRCGTPPP